MKFRSFKEFRDETLDRVIQFLRMDLTSTLRELGNGLSKLTFEDNFESFEISTTILAGQEVEIPNRLPVVPSRRIIVRQSGNGLITDGTTAWNASFLYLRNNGGASVTCTVVFMR